MPDSAADRRSRRGSTQAIALALSLMAFCLAAQPLQQAAVATLQDDVAGHSVTFDEPLWVLPPSAIPDHVRTRPGVEPVRDRGYLDTPEAISGLPIESIDADSDRLHRDLDWNSCGLDTTVARAPARPPAADDDYTDLDAGGLRYRRGTEVIEAVGGVTVTQGDQRIEADRLTYDRNSSVVVGPSGGYLSYGGVRLVGTGLEANLETEQGRVDSPTFRLGGGANARGSAETAYVVSPRRSAYSDIIYTTCPPGSNAWTLRANKLKLDQDKGFGTARDARLRLRGIPVAYTPYLRFPIDDRRRSGFLVPSFGTSDDDGAELLTPYYWNIAPEMDATFFPRIMSKRGVQLGTEFRYLSRDDKGSIRAEILPQDRLYDDGDTPRWALQLRERGLWFGRVRTTLDVRAVSDDRYLEDLGNNINATSSRRLRQFGEASYAGQGWFLSTRLEDYQSLDETLSPFGEPYSRSAPGGIPSQPEGFAAEIQ
jgi:LPS-assembly protein